LYNADAHCGLGKVFMAHKQTKEAEKEYRISLRLNPDNAVAHNRLGNVLMMKGDSTGAEKEYREAIRLHPNYWEAINNLAYLLENQKKPEAKVYRKRAKEAKEKYGPPPVIMKQRFE